MIIKVQDIDIGPFLIYVRKQTKLTNAVTYSRLISNKTGKKKPCVFFFIFLVILFHKDLKA